MKVPKVVVDTDLFIDHLSGDSHPSLLRIAHRKFFCYTTVFQAIELFSLAKSEEETRTIEDSMGSMKVLGLNAKNAKQYGEIFSGTKRNALRSLVGGMCCESRLPLLTGRGREYRGISGLIVVPSEYIDKFPTGQEVLSAVKRPTRRS